MRKFVFLTFLAMAAGVGPALAQSKCDAPIPPATPDGRTASQAQMVGAVGDAKAFIAQSDVYQQCLVDYVKSQRDLATQNKTPFDPSIETDANAKVIANQATKVKVGSEINDAIGMYKSAHPK